MEIQCLSNFTSESLRTLKNDCGLNITMQFTQKKFLYTERKAEDNFFFLLWHEVPWIRSYELYCRIQVPLPVQCQLKNDFDAQKNICMNFARST